MVTLPAESLAEGDNVLRACVSSTSGQAQSTALVTKDTAGPTAPAPHLAAGQDTGARADDGITSVNRLTLTGTTEPGATVVLQRHGDFVGRTTAGPDGSWGLLEPADQPDGVFSYVIRVTDSAGNTTVSPVGVVSIDATPPELVITSGPADGATSTSSPSYGFSAEDLAATTCRLDAGAFVACSSPVSYQGLSAGEHSVDIAAADSAGNQTVVTRHLTVVFSWTGFFRPVDNPPAVNTKNAGSAVPVTFSLGGDQGLGVLAAGSPSSRRVTCDSAAPAGEIEATISASGGLTYDASSRLYSYVWKTDKAWSGTCRQLTVALRDGSTHLAQFRLR